MIPPIQNLSMIGCGQVGTSVLLAMAKQGKTIPTTIYDGTPETEALVRAKFAADGFDSSHLKFTVSIAEAVPNADLIILATPMSAFESAAREIAKHAKEGAILTDMGSAKKVAIENIKKGLSNSTISYVPAHPGNGSQGTGASTASAGNILGRNSTMFLISEEGADYNPPDLSPEGIVRNFWNDMGVLTAFITTEKHDQFFGQCSHFQHAIIFSLMNMAKDSPEILHNFEHAGTALRNMSRVAMGELKDGQPSALAQMWIPIFEQNKEPILKASEHFSKHFSDFIALIKANDIKGLTDKLTQAKMFRDSFDDPERREIITGELDDLRFMPGFESKNTGQLTASFKRHSLSALSTNLLLPVAISYAQLMSAHDIDPEFIKLKSNPSFRDGTHPSTYSITYVTHLIQAQANTLIEFASEFRDKLDKVTNAIHDKDKDYILNTIHSAQSIRNDLPAVRKGEAVREEHERSTEPA